MSDLDGSDSEGLDFDAIFGNLQKKTGKDYASRDDRDKRLKAERRAGLSPKQREHMSEPRKLVNFRATESTRALLDQLMKHFKEDRTAVIHRAIDGLAATVPGIRERK